MRCASELSFIEDLPVYNLLMLMFPVKYAGRRSGKVLYLSDSSYIDQLLVFLVQVMISINSAELRIERRTIEYTWTFQLIKVWFTI